MTPIAWVVEHSLQASVRFRHLTVMRDWLSQEVHDLINSGDSLDYAEALSIMHSERNKK